VFLLDFIGYFILLVCVLVSVAFLTLFERKILGYAQIRRGPVKVGYGGVLQPFADAIRLFVREGAQPLISNFLAYWFCPVLSLFLALAVWIVLPYERGLTDIRLGILFFLCLVGVGVYATIGSGWFSNSKYALLGCLRSVAQTISYEVRLAIVVITMAIIVGGYRLDFFISCQELCWFLFLFGPLGIVWGVVILAETNRTPFDFAEGESELVSGFNVEYGASGFALIFIAEYARILIIRLIFSLFFLGGAGYLVGVKIGLISFVFVWVRSLLPRLRYDILIYLAWRDLLPLVFNYFLFMIGLKIIGIL